MTSLARTAPLVDGLSVTRYALALISYFPLLHDAHPIVIFALILFGPGLYFFDNIVFPLLYSKRAYLPETRFVTLPARTYIRSSKKVDSSVLDFGLIRFIIFRQRHLTGRFQDWKAVLGHEISHIDNHDLLRFHCVALVSRLVGTFWLFLFFWHLIDPLHTLPNGWLSFDSQRIKELLALLAGLAMYLGSEGSVRDSIYHREFRADLASHRLAPTEFSDWLERSAEDESLRPSGFDAWVAKLTRRITHPPFKLRRAHIHGQYDPGKISLAKGVLQCLSIAGFATFSLALFIDLSGELSVALSAAFYVVSVAALLLACLSILEQTSLRSHLKYLFEKTMFFRILVILFVSILVSASLLLFPQSLSFYSTTITTVVDTTAMFKAD